MKAAKMRLNVRRELVSVPLPAFTANGTAPFFILAVSEHPVGNGKERFVLKKLSYGTRTVGVDTDGTMLLNVFKKRGTTATQLVTSFSVEGLTADDDANVPFDAGITKADRTLQGGDVLYGSLVNNSAAIDTNPAAFAQALTVELDALDVRGEGHFDDDGPFS